MTLLHAPLRCSPGLLVLVAACFGYRTGTVAPLPGTRVRLVLAGPTSIAVQPTAPEAPRARYDQVLELSGTVEASSHDTIAVRLGELRTAAGAIDGLAHTVALVPVNQVARLTERHFQAGRTVLGGAGLLLVATSVLVVLLIVTVVKAAGG